LLPARLAGLEADIEHRRRLVRRYREQLRDTPGLTLPYRDEEVELSSCYVMPAMVEDEALRDPLRAHMLERHAVQTSVLYPAIHEFTAYVASGHQSLPRSERAARTQVTLPLHPLEPAEQDRVVKGVRETSSRLFRRARSAAGPA